MWRASFAAALLVASTARADVPVAPSDPRAALATQLADEALAIDRTLALVTEKLTLAEAVRAKRLRAAYRVLRAPIRSDASPEDRMVVARRRAAARLLVDRDAAERGLLAEEAAHLVQAKGRAAGDATQVADIRLPAELGWPAKGPIARGYGTLEHERSKAVLARRGIDIEVETKAPALAPADGTVRYAGPIRGLDDGLVIDHGSYFTVIAKLGELAVPRGAPVRKGDRLGRAARHRVYLEVRVRIGPGGIPIDPEPLLEKSARD